jgi:quercetin dioxygenase-like cupin family protein
MSLEIVRFAELIPCRSAFIDAHTPGSDRKENYTIIGAGVSESPDQHVHIAQTPGFNIGAAAQPAGCTNSLHSHRTAEVFLIHSGTWRFFWGLYGDKGSVTVRPGDTISLPTHMFRGFENITPPTPETPDGYGFMFAVLGGNDAGGGVVWAPQVLEAAQNHGLVLLENGRLLNTKLGETAPTGLRPRKALEGEALAAFDRNTIREEAKAIARRAHTTEWILGTNAAAKLRERTGFSIQRLTSEHTLSPEAGRPCVVICNAGSAKVESALLGAGDVLYAEADAANAISAAANSEVFVITPTDDPAGETTYL